MPSAPAFNQASGSQTAQSDWQQAAHTVAEQRKAHRQRRQAADGAGLNGVGLNGAGLNGAGLNRTTLEFIRDGAATGDRHRLLFSAAANLAEFGCSPALAEALLTETALDSGLSPSEVRRQIACGLERAGLNGQNGEGGRL